MVTNIFNFSEYITEEGDGGGSGVAMANAGTTSGMGAVISAQPSSTPGAVVTGNGTTGSGDISGEFSANINDISIPKNVYTKDGITGNKFIKMDKKSKKNNKSDNVKAFIDTFKNNKPAGKVMNFDDFEKNKFEKVTKVKQ